MRLLILAAVFAVSSALAPLFKHEEKIEGDYIVVLKNDGTLEDVRAGIMNETGIFFKREYRTVFKGFAASLSERALKILRRRKDVAFIEEDSVVKALGDAVTWGLDRVDQRNLPLDGKAQFPGTGLGVNAYIIDTGIYAENKYFEGRASVYYDAIYGDGIDCNGHGTHCAGTVGSNPYGIARMANLYGIRVLDCYGSGSNSGVVAGMDYVAKNHAGPSIASMSLGGYSSTATDLAVRGLVEHGVAVSVAAGNSNADACYYSPAGAPEAITVGATSVEEGNIDDYDERAYFSNYGNCVDIFAPGVDVLSTWINGIDATNMISGTSMACPHVTGVACVLLGNHPKMTPEELKHKLLQDATIDKISDVGFRSPNKLLYLAPNPPKDQFGPKAKDM